MPELATFDAVRIGIASPEDIRKWSHGEVKKPETINYRTFKPEPDGLFCERIFGPVRDYQCHCGKYKKIKFKGIICDRCGVEVTTSKVRRRRMGHIELAAPVCHIWYLRNTPSPIALLLGLSPKEVEQVVYFGKYVVTHVDRRKINASMDRIRWAVEEDIKEIQRLKEESISAIRRKYEEQMAEEGMTEEEKARWRKQMEDRIKREEELFEGDVARLKRGLEVLEGLYKKQLISEEDYRALQKVTEAINRRLGKGFENLWRAGMGAEAIRDLLAEIDLEQLARELRREIRETTGPRRVKAIKRLRMVEAFRKSKNRPEWMILEVLPVLPPDLRPMVQLDGGRFATSDLNDLYRRIINRNNRLKKILQLRAPETIVNHEKRLLQEAVDALIDNSKRRRPVL
ncbi:MAG TPA: DNA-directed RNA polymerase subunit beta', partial [Armatimonadetes bacterium]|nr:DNA-directed RNA polymerase subunit beta' [Armatimonadota bacterium]